MPQFLGSAAELDCLREISKEWQKSQDFWKVDELFESLKRPEVMLFYLVDGTKDMRWVGVLVATILFETAEILFVFVAPSNRRSGNASTLYNEFLNAISKTGHTDSVSDIFLEVRPSNFSAVNFYKKLGFIELKRRRSYYSDGEDAIVMKKSLNIGSQA